MRIQKFTLSQWLKIAIRLSKIRISQLVALSTATGYILATGRIDWFILLPVTGIFLLASGSSAINQIQERDIDPFMKRTRNRPIPAGDVTPIGALLIAFLLMGSGSAILYFGVNGLALTLALFNVVWYNGLYTPLKRRSALAVIPGALIGAVPPVVGWVAGGRSILEAPAWAIAFLFFIWQIPHFWLLLLNFGKDYEEAGFPSLTKKFNNGQLARITFMWILATAATCIFIPLYGIGNSRWLVLGLFVSAVWLVWSSYRLIARSGDSRQFVFAFREINIYIMLVMTMLSADSLLAFSL